MLFVCASQKGTDLITHVAPLSSGIITLVGSVIRQRVCVCVCVFVLDGMHVGGPDLISSGRIFPFYSILTKDYLSVEKGTTQLLPYYQSLYMYSYYDCTTKRQVFRYGSLWSQLVHC